MSMRRGLLPAIIAAGWLAAVPVTADQAPRRLGVPYTMFTLPNGLTVILHEDHSVPVVTINIWYRAGSAHEQPGRTGFAHLFEHLMFEGSAHVEEGDFDNLLEAAGGQNNASTRNDYTNYFINVPSNALDLALFLESDRMGYLLDKVTEELVNGQRDVVKNERRQSYENAPYGKAFLRISELMYPSDHPYHWPVIGYMDDLSAASADDVRNFFRQYYAPGNASLVIAGDIDPAETRRKVEHWFSDIKAGPPAPPIDVPPVALTSVVTEQIEDQVQLPRLMMLWHTPPGYAPGDAELDVVSNVLSGGKNSRLYKRLVYDLQVAQSVSASQNSAPLGSMYLIDIVARPSADPPAVALAKLKALVDEELEKLRQEQPDAREVERALNQVEASFYNRMERVGGFGGKADQMNGYYVMTGNPDYFNEDLSRYLALDPADVQAAVRRWLVPDRRVEITILPAAAGGAR